MNKKRIELKNRMQQLSRVDIKKLFSKKEIRMFMKKEFEKKWNEYLIFESQRFSGVRVRLVRKKDKLMLCTMDGSMNYLQLRFEDKEQFNIIWEALKKDKIARVSES